MSRLRDLPPPIRRSDLAGAAAVPFLVFQRQFAAGSQTRTGAKE